MFELLCALCMHSKDADIALMRDHWQQKEMFTLIGLGFHPDAGSTLFSMGLVGGHEDFRRLEPCSWRGVTCSSNVVREVKWDGFNVNVQQSIAINWLPNSVEVVRMSIFPRCDPIISRCLPLSARIISLEALHIPGSVDFTALPPRLEALRLPNNDITGTVQLTHLPRTLSRIDLQNNHFRTLVVDNSSLPENLTEIRFKRSSLKPMRTFCVDGDKLDTRISFR